MSLCRCQYVWPEPGWWSGASARVAKALWKQPSPRKIGSTLFIPARRQVNYNSNNPKWNGFSWWKLDSEEKAKQGVQWIKERKKNRNCSQTRSESLFNSPPVVMFSHVELFSHPIACQTPHIVNRCKGRRSRRRKRGMEWKKKNRFGSFFQAVTMKAEEITLNGLNSAIRWEAAQRGLAGLPLHIHRSRMRLEEPAEKMVS